MQEAANGILNAIGTCFVGVCMGYNHALVVMHYFYPRSARPS